MSRLYVTSSRTRMRRAEDISSELQGSGSYEGEGCFARSYRKPSSNEDSFLRVGPGDFLAIAGTAIYNGGLGEERKEEIYELFAEGGVEQVRSEILGHYAIAVKNGDEITLFTDPLGSFALYYTRGGESWFVSNSLYTCAASCDRVSLDGPRLLATIFQSGLPADRTFYQEIRQLFGSQVIRIDVAEGALRVEECAPPTYPLPKSPTSVPEAVEQYTERVRSVFGRIAEIGELGVMLTGGPDSRTVLAGLLDQGAAPVVLSGTGENSTKTSDQDHRVAKKIAGEFDLDFRPMDWSDRQPHGREALERSFEKYGFKHEVYGSPEQMVKYLSGQGGSTPKLMLGGYSPAFTKERPWRIENDGVGAGYVLEKYVDKKAKIAGIVEKGEYKRRLKRDIEKRRKLKIGEKERGKYQKIKMDLKIQRDARFANFVNEFTGYIDPFRTKRLYDPLREMDAELREKNRTQIGVMGEMEPKLTDIDVYSGWERKKIEDGRLEERGVKVTMRDRVSTRYLKRKTRNLVSRHTPSAVKEAMESVRKALSSVWPQVHRDHAMRREYARRLSDRAVVQRHAPNVSALPLKALARFEYFMVGVESVADTIEQRLASDSRKR